MYKPTIVLLEDDLILQDIIKKSLENEKYNVFCGEKFLDAIHLVYWHTPDIVIIDLFLKDSGIYGTGVLAAKQIEKINHGCKFIFISSSDVLIDYLDIFETHFLAKFVKPINISELVAVIKEYEKQAQ